LVIGYRRFGIIYRFHLQRSNIPWRTSGTWRCVLSRNVC